MRQESCETLIGESYTVGGGKGPLSPPILGWLKSLKVTLNSPRTTPESGGGSLFGALDSQEMGSNGENYALVMAPKTSGAGNLLFRLRYDSYESLISYESPTFVL